MTAKTLYLCPGACSLAVHIVLREIGEQVDLVAVDLRTKRLADGSDYRAISPRGQVPTLRLEDGTLLTEGPAINQRLADAHPEARLLAPIPSEARYRTLEWLNFIATELHRSFSPLVRPLTPELREQTVARFVEKLAIVDAHLAGRALLVGEDFTIADAYLFVISTWLARVGIDDAPFPNLTAFAAGVAARPAVAAAIEAERGLLPDA